MKTIQDSDCDQSALCTNELQFNSLFAHTCSYLPKHPYRHTKVVTQVSADSIINLSGGRSLPFIPHTLINSLYNMYVLETHQNFDKERSIRHSNVSSRLRNSLGQVKLNTGHFSPQLHCLPNIDN